MTQAMPTLESGSARRAWLMGISPFTAKIKAEDGQTWLIILLASTVAIGKKPC